MQTLQYEQQSGFSSPVSDPRSPPTDLTTDKSDEGLAGSSNVGLASIDGQCVHARNVVKSHNAI